MMTLILQERNNPQYLGLQYKTGKEFKGFRSLNTDKSQVYTKSQVKFIHTYVQRVHFLSHDD